MRNRVHDRRRLAGFFTAALLLHALLLLIPSTREAIRQAAESSLVRVKLSTPPVPTPSPAIQPREPVQTEALPPPPEPVLRPAPEPVLITRPSEQPETPPVIAPTQPNSNELLNRILSTQFDYQERPPLFGSRQADENSPEYQPREQTSLDQALNEPSLQLPFRDTRTYVVNYYEEGIGGSIDKFWDTVTVPFGFTTKNNTRVQCAWILVFAACGWDHKTVFHREATKRKPGPDDGLG